MLHLIKRAVSSITANLVPPAGYVGLWPDSATGQWYSVDEAGVKTPLVNGVTAFNGRSGAVTPVSGDYSAFYDALGAASAAQAASQPLDSDLTAIAALTTTSFGRNLLTLASAAALSASLAVATPTAQGAMSAADKAQLNNLDLAQVNILDFAADQNSATLTALQNGTTAIGTALAAAVAALPNGGVILFPPGVYNFTAGFSVNTAHITLRGAARYNTVFLTSSTTGDILTLNQYYITVEGVTFTGPGSGQNPTKTAGYAVNVNAANAAYGVVKNCSLTYQYNGINIGCTLMEVDDLEIRYFKNNALEVTQNSDHRITKVTADNNTSFLPTGAGISVTASASLLLDRLNLIHCNNVLDIAPGSGVTVPSVKGVNCFFDTSAIGLRMVSAGSFFRSQFTNCWFSSMSVAGVQFGPTTAGNQVDGITFVNCDIYNNVAGTTTGISVTTGNVGKWKLIASNVAGWTTGISVVAGANHFPVISNSTIGAISAFGVNTTGIAVAAGTYKGLIIQGNDCADNTTAISLGAVTVSAAGNYRIVDNAGINPRGTVAQPAVPASTVVATNTTGFRVSIFLRAGTITAISVNGVATGVTASPSATGTLAAVLDPGGTIAITYTVAPTWVWIAN